MKMNEENGFYCKHFRPVVRNGQFICACENATLPWSLDAMVVCNNDIMLCPYVLALQREKKEES